MTSKSDKIAVVAIDFGTTFSGWALSFHHEYKQNPLKVLTQNWHNGENGTMKTSSAVLVEKDGEKLKAFGYKAEDEFLEILDKDPDNHCGYFFFKRFKMLLYNEKELTKSTNLVAENGKTLPAIRVFKLAIQYLKDDALEETKKRLGKALAVTEVHWTLTVPALWNEKAKKFMREAAGQAGIPDDNLTIVKEPEAASICCKNQPVNTGDSGVQSFQRGTKYIVLDCGGGTIDISVHEVLGDRTIREIHRVKGNDLGGMSADRAFVDFLQELFGETVWSRFTTERKTNHASFFRSFELKKRQLSPDQETFNVMLPYDLYQLYQKENDTEFEVGVKTSRFGGIVVPKHGTTVGIKSDFLKGIMFEKTIAGIVKCVQNILQTTGLEDIHNILLVGGFGDSKILQFRLKQEFPKMTFIVPADPSLAVLIGAAIFGHDTSVVRERVAPYTYGTRIAIKYDPAKHSEEEIKNYDTGKKVLSFKLLAKVNDSIENESELDVGSYVPVKETQEEIVFPIYAVDMDRKADTDNDADDDAYVPEYASDKRCTKLGEISAPITDRSVPLNERKFNLKILFGTTEIEGVVTDERTKEKSKAVIKFID